MIHTIRAIIFFTYNEWEAAASCIQLRLSAMSTEPRWDERFYGEYAAAVTFHFEFYYLYTIPTELDSHRHQLVDLPAPAAQDAMIQIGNAAAAEARIRIAHDLERVVSCAAEFPSHARQLRGELQTSWVVTAAPASENLLRTRQQLTQLRFGDGTSLTANGDREIWLQCSVVVLSPYWRYVHDVYLQHMRPAIDNVLQVIDDNWADNISDAASKLFVELCEMTRGFDLETVKNFLQFVTISEEQINGFHKPWALNSRIAYPLTSGYPHHMRKEVWSLFREIENAPTIEHLLQLAHMPLPLKRTDGALREFRYTLGAYGLMNLSADSPLKSILFRQREMLWDIDAVDRWILFCAFSLRMCNVRQIPHFWRVYSFIDDIRRRHINWSDFHQSWFFAMLHLPDFVILQIEEEGFHNYIAAAPRPSWDHIPMPPDFATRGRPLWYLPVESFEDITRRLANLGLEDPPDMFRAEVATDLGMPTPMLMDNAPVPNPRQIPQAALAGQYWTQNWMRLPPMPQPPAPPPPGPGAASGAALHSRGRGQGRGQDQSRSRGHGTGRGGGGGGDGGSATETGRGNRGRHTARRPGPERGRGTGRATSRGTDTGRGQGRGRSNDGGRGRGRGRGGPSTTPPAQTNRLDAELDAIIGQGFIDDSDDDGDDGGDATRTNSPNPPSGFGAWAASSNRGRGGGEEGRGRGDTSRGRASSGSRSRGRGQGRGQTPAPTLPPLPPSQGLGNIFGGGQEGGGGAEDDSDDGIE